MDDSVLPVLPIQASSLSYSNVGCVLFSILYTMNVSVYMITTARMAAGYFDLSQQEVRIEYPPIVLSKTMINPEVWTCFHHNRHRPVRTVVA